MVGEHSIATSAAIRPEELELSIQDVGAQLAAAFAPAAQHPLRALDARAMELATADAELRAALLRLVDVAPACRSLDDLAAHLRGYLDGTGERTLGLAAAIKLSDTAAGRRALGAAAAAGVRHLAHRFIVAETPRAAGRLVQGLWRDGIATSLDLLGEETVTAAEADRYAQRCHEALDRVHEAHAGLPRRSALERDAHGEIPRANLSVKVSALTPLLRADAPARGKRDAARRLRAVLRHARDLGAHLHVDMESLDSRATVTELVLELLSEREFRAGPSAGIVVQAYLRDGSRTLGELIDWAASQPREPPLVIRLVKGAYWDHEVVQAAQHGWQAPVFDDKAECDRSFEALTVRLLRHRDTVRVAVGSHNLRSVSHAIAANRALGGGDGELELQVLRGLGDDLAGALAARGFRVRAYCPVGDLVAGMAYLVRRLLENTSNESFLHERARGAPLRELLAAP